MRTKAQVATPRTGSVGVLPVSIPAAIALALAELYDRFTVIAWDAPGAGRSSDPPGPFAMADIVEAIASHEPNGRPAPPAGARRHGEGSKAGSR